MPDTHQTRLLPSAFAMIRTGAAAAALFAGIPLGIAAAPGTPEAVVLQPHRIAYQVALGPKSSGGAFTAAEGLIAIEFTGNSCDGYITNFRQATSLSDADGQTRDLDFRVNLWEGGNGKAFRFTVLNKVNGETARDADGEARHVKDGSITVAMNRPSGKKGDFDGAISFPSAMMIDLLGAARRGDKRFEARVFDGSDGGERIFDTIATIGAALEGDKNERLEAPLRAKDLDRVPRWPIAIAYYDPTPGDRMPVYTMKSVTFANGVVSDLLFEFPEFSLTARAVRYEALPLDSCVK